MSALTDKQLAALAAVVTDRSVRPDVCPRCNGLGGAYVPSNGGRTFVGCGVCKGSGR